MVEPVFGADEALDVIEEEELEGMAAEKEDVQHKQTRERVELCRGGCHITLPKGSNEGRDRWFFDCRKSTFILRFCDESAED